MTLGSIRLISRPARLVMTLIMVAATLMAVPSVASAHYLWATVEKGHVRFALLENPGDVPNAQFENYVANLIPRCGDKTLTLSAARQGARYADIPTGQNLVTVESVVGARVREGTSYLLVYHAKGAASLAAAATLTHAPAELLARKENQELVVSLRLTDAAVPQTQVWVQWPGGNAEQFKTDSRGDLRVPWMTARLHSGFVGIRAMIIQERAGKSAGTPYTSIHRWATLTFPLNVEGSQTEVLKNDAIVAGDKPLTQLLREAYGSSHEIVGNTAFNQTLFAGKLTYAQLEMHLQQRALIHNEVHRILNAASHRDNLPYGATQKHPLVLLFTDLITMGSGWPTEGQTRPLTRAFLQEIRDSEKQGPYFALGVFHVYYGGITNGGRVIGKKIGDTLQFLPTYYEQSDGYDAYLVEVNKVTDSAARQEMVRGGQAAYKYLIAFGNEPLFQAQKVPGSPSR